MDHRTFEEWFSSTLLPIIPSNSIIVMDNAPYHSRQKERLPTKSWTKAMLTEWLSRKGISYPERCLKCHLWSIVEKNRPRSPIYVVDDLASQAGMSWLNFSLVVIQQMLESCHRSWGTSSTCSSLRTEPYRIGMGASKGACEEAKPKVHSEGSGEASPWRN